ncbi:MAG TPA: hypothetical protein VGT44_09735, partial [Ktedonobacteraceae bacterium]|nr:hypothetical protein [Ktedonobacteraceae bacterium]
MSAIISHLLRASLFLRRFPIPDMRSCMLLLGIAPAGPGCGDSTGITLMKPVRPGGIWQMVYRRDGPYEAIRWGGISAVLVSTWP